jgi:hypothetical protein
MAKKARKDGPTTSQLIRDHLAAHPGDGPQAVAAALKSNHGREVTPQFVSTVKSNDKKRKRRRGRKARGPGRPAAAANDVKLSMEALMAAKKFVAQMGGVGKAKSAVDTLARLLD